MRVEECFDDIADFDKLLNAAEENAVENYEMDFVSDMQDKYRKYSHRMYLSDKQLALLEKIANK